MRGGQYAVLLVLAAASCRQAVGDRCDEELRCERGLDCVEGRCLPAPAPSGLELLRVDERVETRAVAGPVDVVVDRDGTPHVYATSLEDAWAGVGYISARQGFGRMELSRRAASGTAAELRGGAEPETVAQDLLARLLGLRASAAASFSEMPEQAEERAPLVGFARGVTTFIERARAGDEVVAEELHALLAAAEPEWTPVDSLAVARLELLRRSWSGDSELELHLLVQRGIETFDPDSRDRDLARRAGFVEDVVRFEPLLPTTGWEPRARSATGLAGSPGLPSLASARAEAWLRSARAVRALAGAEPGSAGFVAGGAVSASGGGLLAATLGGPFEHPPRHQMVHLAPAGAGGPGESAGLCVAGVPAFVVGFGRDVAFAALPSGSDLVDLYLERIVASAEGGRAAARDGEAAPLEPVVLSVGGAAGQLFELETARVAGRGPLVPAIDEAGGVVPGWDEVGLAVAWAGEAARRLLEVPSRLGRAQTVAEALEAVRADPDGSRVWLVADRAGSAAATHGGCVPVRERSGTSLSLRLGLGATPAVVMAGEGGGDWRGCVAAELLPGVGPESAAGLAVAAGQDLAGGSFEGRPFRSEPYLGWDYEPGHRAARLEELLAGTGRAARLDAAGSASVLADERVALVPALVPALRRALARAREEQAERGTHSDLARVVEELGERLSTLEAAADRLADWDGTAAPDSATAALAAAWMVELVALVLGDELDLLGVRPADRMLARAMVRLVEPTTALRTTDPLSGESTLFDDVTTPRRIESRDERLVRSVDQALGRLERDLGPDPTGWRWADAHVARARRLPYHPAPSVAATGVGGAFFSVGGCDPGLSDTDLGCESGQAARLAVELTPWGPVARLAVAFGPAPAGVDRPGDLETWAGGGSREVPFALDDVVAQAALRIVLEPAGGAPEAER